MSLSDLGRGHSTDDAGLSIAPNRGLEDTGQAGVAEWNVTAGGDRHSTRWHIKDHQRLASNPGLQKICVEGLGSRLIQIQI